MDYNTSILTINKYVEKPDKIIEVIEKFYNFTRGLEIYIGLVAIVSAIYIYCIGFTDTFKKNILIFLMGEERILLILVSVLLFYFFNIPSIYFISLTIVLFYFLYKAIKLIFLIMNHRKFEEAFFSEIVPKFKKLENGNGLNNLYQEIQVNLYQAIIDRNLIRVEELLTFLKEFLVFQENENNNSERIEYPEEKLIPFFYKCYKHLIEVPDINILLALSDISIYLGDFYLERKDYKKAQSCYSLIELNYEYYIKNYKEDIFLNIGSSLFSSLGNKIGENIEEIIAWEGALLKLIYKVIQLEDYKNLEEFLIFYNLDYLNNGIYKKMKIYSMIIIINFLNKKENTSNDLKLKKEDILFKLEGNVIYYSNTSVLEEIYELNQEKDLERKLNLNDLKFPRFDFKGMSSYSCSATEIIAYILIFMDKHRQELKEEFVLKYSSAIDQISNLNNLNFLKGQLELHKVKIGIKDAQKNYNIRIDRLKLKSSVDTIKKTKKEIKVFKILQELSNYLGESNNYCLDEEFIRSNEYIVDNEYINSQMFIRKILEDIQNDFEYLIIQNLKNQRNILLKVLKLDDFIIFVSKETFYNIRDKYKEKKELLNNIYPLNINFIDKNLAYFIKKKSISSIIYKTQIEVKSLDQSYLKKIKGFSDEEKKIKLKGMSKLILSNRIKFVYNSKEEIYKVDNILDYLKEN